MNQNTQPLRQRLKQQIAREAVALSDNKLQVTLTAYFQGDTSSLSIRNAQKDDRDPHRIEVYALHLVEGLLEKCEAGMAQILDARPAGLHEKYRELAWAGVPGRLRRPDGRGGEDDLRARHGSDLRSLEGVTCIGRPIRRRRTT